MLQRRHAIAISLLLSVGIFFFLLLGYGRFFVFSSFGDTISSLEDYSISLDRESSVIVFDFFSSMYADVDAFAVDSINYWDDSSLYRYVSRIYPFQNMNYIPPDLVLVDASYIVMRAGPMRLRKPASDALHDLAKAFYEEFGKKLFLVSAYRSLALQKSLVRAGCSTDQCALPGTSEHQAGLAIDIHVAMGNGMRQSLSDTQSRYYIRLQDNAHRYGFHNTYQKGIDIDGQIEEGWHWRYLGVRLATYLHEQDMSFAQWYEEQER